MVRPPGAAGLIQGLGRANARTEMPADAPFWMRAAPSLIGTAPFAAFAAPAPSSLSAATRAASRAGLPFLGAFNVSLARSMLGFGAPVCWLAAVRCAVPGGRKRSRHGQRAFLTITRIPVVMLPPHPRQKYPLRRSDVGAATPSSRYRLGRLASGASQQQKKEVVA